MMSIKQLMTSAMILLTLSGGVYAADQPPTNTHGAYHAKAAMTAKVNINTASAEELMKVKGIGAKRAAAIIAYRTQHGKFASLEELTKVKGVNAKFLAKNRDHLTIDKA